MEMAQEAMHKRVKSRDHPRHLNQNYHPKKSRHIAWRKKACTPLQYKHRIQITLENVNTFSMISAKTSEKY